MFVGSTAGWDYTDTEVALTGLPRKNIVHTGPWICVTICNMYFEPSAAISTSGCQSNFQRLGRRSMEDFCCWPLTARAKSPTFSASLQKHRKIGVFLWHMHCCFGDTRVSLKIAIVLVQNLGDPNFSNQTMPPWGIAPFPRVVNANREIQTSPVKISLKTWVMISFPPPNPSKSQLLLEQKPIGFRLRVGLEGEVLDGRWKIPRVGKHGRIVYKWGLVLPLPGYIIYWVVTSCYFQFMAMFIGNIGQIWGLKYLKGVKHGILWVPHFWTWAIPLPLGLAAWPVERWSCWTCSPSHDSLNHSESISAMHKSSNTIKQYQAPVCQRLKRPWIKQYQTPVCWWLVVGNGFTV